MTDTTAEATVTAINAEPEEQPYNTLLRVFREMLVPAEDAALQPVTPHWAMKIVTQYPGVTFADMVIVKDEYFGLLEELKAITEFEIESDPKCLSYDNVQEDMAENRHHYLNLLLEWQKAIKMHELTWDCTDPKAPAQLAAISGVHKMFFGQTGLTAFLGESNFEFTDDDQALIAQELDNLRGGDSE